jgi:hypothetical protein
MHVRVGFFELFGRLVLQTLRVALPLHHGYSENLSFEMNAMSKYKIKAANGIAGTASASTLSLV